MHMTVARELASQLRHDALVADPGAYYLGATTPDIRAMTRCDRIETHFFDLNCFDEQSGVAGALSAHPELARPSQLNPSTVAFFCGYISHLEMDEAWICDVYRPCFGRDSTVGDSVLANLLDRALQFELDRRARDNAGMLADIRNDLLATSIELIESFIERPDLERWRDINADLLTQPPDWERFRSQVARHLRRYGVESEADIAHFFENVPDLIDKSIGEATPERIDAFLARSRRKAREAIEAYLS
jgi:hypothetical protein